MTDIAVVQRWDDSSLLPSVVAHNLHVNMAWAWETHTILTGMVALLIFRKLNLRLHLQCD